MDEKDTEEMGREPTGEDPDSTVNIATPESERVDSETQATAHDPTERDNEEHMIAGHENDETVIVDKGKNHDTPYRWYLIGTDGHKIPVWPDETDHYRDLINEFEANTGNTTLSNSIPEDADPILQALPDAPLPMEKIKWKVTDAKVQSRGCRPLNHFYEGSGLPTAFYVLSSPGMRVYGYDTTTYDWHRIVTIDNADETSTISTIKKVEQIATDWHNDRNEPV